MSCSSNAPDLAALKAWLGLASEDAYDDAVLQASLDAALQQQAQVVSYPLDDYDDRYYSPDLVDAIFLRAQRLAARRNSPEGVVGLSGMGGDFVSARVPAYDTDVSYLEAPYRAIATA